MRRVVTLAVLAMNVLAACAPAAGVAPVSGVAAGTPAASAPEDGDLRPPATELPIPTQTEPAASAAVPTPAVAVAPTNVRVFDERVYSFSQLLPFDGIRPVYTPQFATVDEAPLQDDELVIGITLGGESKAYPITVLRFREMVNDELGGIPILVTW